MKVRALKDFRDLEADARRKPGDEWDVTEERLEQLNSAYSFPLVEPVEEEPEPVEESSEEAEEPVEEEPEEKPKRRTRRKAE